MYKFTIPGKPEGKRRHRSTKGSRQYNPKENADYDSKVKYALYQKHGEVMPQDGYFEVVINAYFPIPASTSQKKKDLMSANVIRPDKKPDVDNIAKIVLDALNSIVYRDDKQVIKVSVEKFYSYDSRVEVSIYKI